MQQLKMILISELKEKIILCGWYKNTLEKRTFVLYNIEQR